MTKNKIYCYWEDLDHFRDGQWLLNRWSDNWRSFGFDPIVLSLNDARRYKKFQKMDAMFGNFPSVNPAGYERANFRRWCAYSTISGLTTDADCFNISFEPTEPGELTFYERNRVPCAVSGTPDQFERVLQWFLDFKLGPNNTIDGKNHVSDMYVITEHSEAKTLDWVGQWPDTSRRMLHIANDSCGGNKIAAVKRFFSQCEKSG